MTTDPTPEAARYRCAEEADATQWIGSNAEQLRAFCGSYFDTIDPEDRGEDPDETAAVRSHTHGGWIGLKPGDWVVKHADHFSAASDEEFRERWAAVSPPPATDRAALRELVAEALMRWAEGNNDPQYARMRRSETVRANAYGRADAVLAALPPAADRAAVLREAADALDGLTQQPDMTMPEGRWRAGLDAGIRELRRLAAGERDEQQTQQDGAEARERGRAQLLEAMSAVSEDRTCTGWAADWARALHTEGGIWETLGRAVGWPTGNYDQWVWVSWDEAAAQYAAAPVAGQPPADTGEEARPRLVRVCTPCPECDHTLDENGTCANGCHPKDAHPVPTRKPVPAATPEQIERLMFRLLAHAGNGAGQQDLFRIGKRAGVFWTHPDCTRPKGISMLTDERCVHCGADRPATKGARP